MSAVSSSIGFTAVLGIAVVVGGARAYLSKGSSASLAGSGVIGVLLFLATFMLLRSRSLAASFADDDDSTANDKHHHHGDSPSSSRNAPASRREVADRAERQDSFSASRWWGRGGHCVAIAASVLLVVVFVIRATMIGQSGNLRLASVMIAVGVASTSHHLKKLRSIMS